jgi:hypothetical protein
MGLKMNNKNKEKWVMEIFSLARKHKIKLKVDEIFLYDYKVYQADFIMKERNDSFEDELCKKKNFSFSVYEQDDNWKIKMFNRSNLL